jgi:type I restriction enzyme S subunit
MEKVLLTSISRPKQWKTISGKDLLESGYPVYGANGKIGFYNSYTHEHPTLLITCRGATCGSINISDPKSYVNGNAMALDNLSEEVDLYYLKYYLEYRKLDDVISGSAQPQITGKGLSKVKIPLPPLDQQKKIASILDAADAYRQKTKALITKYDELTQSLFLDMFGDTWLNPNEYKLHKLSELVNEGKIITYGIVQAGDHIEDGVPYIRTGDIKNGKIKTQGLLKTSQEIANSYKRSKCSAGDIIMSIRATVGTIAFLPGELDGANLTQGTARISTDDKLANPLYLYHCIKSKGIQLRIDQQTKGATFIEITLTRLRNIEIPLPALELQNQFADSVKAIEAQKAQAQASLAQAEDLFNSLLQRAFKGELTN